VFIILCSLCIKNLESLRAELATVRKMTETNDGNTDMKNREHLDDICIRPLKKEDDMSLNKCACAQINVYKLLTENYNLTIKELQEQEILELAIVQYAQTISEKVSKLIPDANVVKKNASWTSNVPPLGNYLLVDYRNLDFEQRKAIIEAYNGKYNKTEQKLECFTLEDFECQIGQLFGAYATGHIRHGKYNFQQTICFELETLCQFVLKDLAPFLTSTQ
jgi:hypothetical protein